LWDIDDATNQDRTIGAWDIGMEVWAIGGVPNLRLEVLLGLRHVETSFQLLSLQLGNRQFEE
jgi:hypothetical protein